jgi:hypothetical protein
MVVGLEDFEDFGGDLDGVARGVDAGEVGGGVVGGEEFAEAFDFLQDGGVGLVGLGAGGGGDGEVEGVPRTLSSW